MQDYKMNVQQQRIKLLITTLEAVTHTVKQHKKKNLQRFKKPAVTNNNLFP